MEKPLRPERRLKRTSQTIYECQTIVGLELSTFGSANRHTEQEQRPAPYSKIDRVNSTLRCSLRVLLEVMGMRRVTRAV